MTNHQQCAGGGQAGSHSVSNTVVCQPSPRKFTVTFISDVSFRNFCKISAVVTFHLRIENFALLVVLLGNEYIIKKCLRIYKTNGVTILAVNSMAVNYAGKFNTKRLTMTSSQISFNSFSIVFKYSLLISVSFF